MQNYQEDVLIKKGVTYFLAPSLLLGVLSFYFPVCYSMIPAHESGLCFCTLLNDDRWFPLLPTSLKTYLILNTLVFYSVNWVFLFSIIFMLNKIRHIKDRLRVREEMGYIVVTWTIFCYAQYTTYLFAQADGCDELRHSFSGVYVASFWIIILRDLLVLGITWFYVNKVDSLVTSQRVKSIEDG